MTTTTKERIKTDLEQAKQEGKQRAERIGDILKAAASMTLEELKEGSAELNGLTRKSVAEWLEELQETAEVADVEQVDVNPEVASEPVAEPLKSTVPTWQMLLKQVLEIVRDRKGDWLQQFIQHWQTQTTKFDAEMTEDYGDRYLKAKSIFQRVVAWARSTQNRTTQPSDVQNVRPVTIEVMDGESAYTTAEKKADLLQASTSQDAQV